MKLIKVRDTYLVMHWATEEDLKTMYGIDIEAENVGNLIDRLMKKFPDERRSDIALEIITAIVED